MSTQHKTWQLRNVIETAHGQFKAFVAGPKGKRYLVGTFETEADAFAAIFDAMTARWTG